jgi:hypothetical protein
MFAADRWSRGFSMPVATGFSRSTAMTIQLRMRIAQIGTKGW